MSICLKVLIIPILQFQGMPILVKVYQMNLMIILMEDIYDQVKLFGGYLTFILLNQYLQLFKFSRYIYYIKDYTKEKKKGPKRRGSGEGAMWSSGAG